LLLAVFPSPAKDGKDWGEVLDRPALARVESYCVDIAGFADDEVYLVKGFLMEQGKPKGLLKDLRWKRVEDCIGFEPDARIKIEFPFLDSLRIGPGDTRISTRDQRDRLKAVLRVFENSTSKIIYTAEALPLESAYSDPVMVGTNLYDRRLDALRRAFEQLIHDVRRVPPQPAKEAR
jgi:hypothetical protein